jgi:transposase
MILAYQQGQTWKQIAETFDVSRQLVYRRIRSEIAA